MNLCNSFLVLCIGSTLLTTAAIASPGQVTFQGEVATQTCKPTINGLTNGIVLLPTVTASELATKGNIAGLTPFTISVTGCSAVKDAELKLTTRFLGYSTTPGGNLGNIAAINPAKGVSIQLTQNADGTTPINLNGLTKVEGLVLAAGKTDANHRFAARYFAEDAVVTAGAVTAIAEYTLTYQ